MIKDVRFRTEKYTKKIISEDLYKKWIEENQENSKYSYKEFCDFWELLANKYIEKTCTIPQGIKFPLNMGEVSLKYATSTNLNRNYRSSNLAKEPVGYLNFGTNGKNGKIVWSIAHVRKINSELPLIGFQGCRKFTQKASKAFYETPEIFRISRFSKGNRINKINKYNSNDQ